MTVGFFIKERMSFHYFSHALSVDDVTTMS